MQTVSLQTSQLLVELVEFEFFLTTSALLDFLTVMTQLV